MKLTLFLILILFQINQCLHKKQVHDIDKVVTPKGNEKRQLQQPDLDIKKLIILNSKGEFIKETIDSSLYDDYTFQHLCHITKDINYQFCSIIQDCATCASSKWCGWCASTQQCIPGSNEHAKCPQDCLNGWVFDQLDKDTCKTANQDKVYKSGKLDNISKDSTKFITALITQPKFRIRNIIQHSKPLHIDYPVGKLETKTTFHFTDQNGQFASNETINRKSISKSISVNIPTNPTIETQYYDAETNDLLNGKQEPVFHAQ